MLSSISVWMELERQISFCSVEEILIRESLNQCFKSALLLNMTTIQPQTQPGGSDSSRGSGIIGSLLRLPGSGPDQVARSRSRPQGSADAGEDNRVRVDPPLDVWAYHHQRGVDRNFDMSSSQRRSHNYRDYRFTPPRSHINTENAYQRTQSIGDMSSYQ